MPLYKSIFLRKSVRHYKMDSFSSRLLEEIHQYSDKLVPYDKNTITKIELIDCIKSTSRIKGAFTVKAPYYLAFYTEEGPNANINIGYMAEQMVLYLHSKGIGSCYLGNAKPDKQKIEQETLHFSFLLALGFPKDSLNREPQEAKRIELSKLCIVKDSLQKPHKTLLEAARIAPSSMNSQPWRFVVYDKRIHIFMQKSKVFNRLNKRLYEVNIGIMLSHLAIASEELWLESSFSKLENITNKSIPNNTYITSLLWK